MRHPYTVHKTAPRRRRHARTAERPTNLEGYAETAPTESAIAQDRTLSEDCGLLQPARKDGEEHERPLDRDDEAAEAESLISRTPRQRGIE